MSLKTAGLLGVWISLLGFLTCVIDYSQTASGQTIELPETGQVGCYSETGAVIPCAGTGEDGDHLSGIAWPNPRFSINNCGTASDLSDDVVTDLLTGLMWSRNANPQGPKSWQDALAVSNGFTLCGFTDWRLPNAHELESLFNGQAVSNADWLTAQGFLNLWNQFYWSSTSAACPGCGWPQWASAWMFNMSFWADQHLTPSLKSDVHGVWPVRSSGQSSAVQLPKTGQSTCYDTGGAVIPCSGTGQDGELQAGQSWPGQRFEVNSQCVTDHLTGLTWVRDPGVASSLWQQSLNNANNLALCGFTDWRLPNVHEQRSLFHYGQVSSSQWLSTQGFTNISNTSYYWTSTTAASNPPSGWLVSMTPGIVVGFLKTTAWLAWPVRGPDLLPPAADLSIQKTDSPDPVIVGNQLTYTLSITNNGPDGATAVLVSDPLPGTVTFVSAISTQGGCNQSSGTVTCDLGSILNGAGANVTIVVVPTQQSAGLNNKATVTANEVDPDATNNSGTSSTIVNPSASPSLTVARSGAGSGIVVTQPPGISCGNICSAAFNGNPDVRLIASAHVDSIFTGWSGDPDCADGIVTTGPAKACTANFDRLETAQMSALQLLQSESSRWPKIRFSSGLPRFVDVRVPVPGGLPNDPVVKALDFLKRYKDLYLLQSPGSELYLKRIVSDPEVLPGDSTVARDWHVFFAQQKNGISINGSVISVHISGNNVTGTSGNYSPTSAAFDEEPSWPDAEESIAVDAAETIALANIQGSNLRIAGKSRLAYFVLSLASGGASPASDSSKHLAWRIAVRGIDLLEGVGTSWTVFVDAHDGTVLWRLRQSFSLEPDKNFDIRTASNTNDDDCWDDSNQDVQWFDQNGATGYPGLANDLFSDGQNAFNFSHQTYDYYHSNFDRHSWQGWAFPNLDVEWRLRAFVHVGVNLNNAFYVPVCDHIEFGDGQVQNDAFAHEFTHGVTEWTSGLVYANQSGALNESYSDVFGAFVDADWTESEDSAGGYIRNLADPPDRNDPDHRDPVISGDNTGLRPGCDDPEDNNCSDFGGVHTNSGIPNKVGYLITMGGVHNGIAVEPLGLYKAQRLYYDVLTRRLSHNADFDEARDDTVAQAQVYVDDLSRYAFRQGDVCSVMNAWASVGYGVADVDCDGIPDDDDTDDDWDHILDDDDNCPGARNADQFDFDGDGVGDACDPDLDGDLINNLVDNCPDVANLNQNDTDGDGIGNVCEENDGDGIYDVNDYCPDVADESQVDNDGDGVGNACDPDMDGDGILNEDDNCPLTANPGQQDWDVDGVGMACDNCMTNYNPGQEDWDHDRSGDICDEDDDNDGFIDSTDDCPLERDPQQLDLDHNGIGTACDSDEAFLLSGNGIGMDGSLNFADLESAITIPIFPCLQDGCPDWIAPGYQSRISVDLPLTLQARIVDERGFSVGNSAAGASMQLGLIPDADFFYRSGFESLGIRRDHHRTSNPGMLQPINAQNYFLQIRPNGSVIPGQNYPVQIRVQSGAFTSYVEDFQDGDLSDWTIKNGTWTASGGELTASHNRKSEAIAPFAGCSVCSFQTVLTMSPGTITSMLGWYAGKKNYVELQMNEPKNRWILKHRVNGHVVSNVIFKQPIDPNHNYRVKMTFDGNRIQVFVGKQLIIDLPAAAAPFGGIGFRIKPAAAPIATVVFKEIVVAQSQP